MGKIQFFLLLIIVVCSLLAPKVTSAQVSQINVDQLSDTQVRQYWQRAQAQGYNINQVESMATGQGMSSMDARKLANRIRQLDESKKSENIQNSDQRRLNQDGGTGIFSTSGDPFSSELSLSYIEERLFGFSVFYNKQFDFSPNFNMATPRDYIVGPGDELVIQVYGTSQETYNLSISAEGKIIIPLIGPVHVGGFNMEAVEAVIIKDLGRIYAGLRRKTPTVFAQVTIGNIRSIKVNIVGEIQNPGTYLIPSFSNVFNALYASGGPTENGTFREIKVYRANKLLSTIDVYDFLVKGQNNAGFSLTDNDIIIVGAYTKRIEIEGEVKIPGIFEVLPNETLEDLINYAGGFSNTAYPNNITVERLSGTKQFIKDVEVGDTNFEFKDGDRIVVREAYDAFIEKVKVMGAVQQPGSFGWYEGLTLDDLIKKSDGLLPHAFTEKAIIFRRGANLRAELESIQLEDVLSSGNDFLMLSGDLLYIPSVFNLEESQFVKVSGEINRPGSIPYFKGMMLSDIILLSGGLKNAALSGSAELARRSSDSRGQTVYDIQQLSIPENLSGLKSSELDIELMPFDHVFVRTAAGYQEESTVTIEGEVNYPGEYVISSSNMRLSDLMNRAGSYTEFAYLEGATLYRRTEEFKEENNLDQAELARLENLYFMLSDNGLFSESISKTQRESLKRRIEEIEIENNKNKESQTNNNLIFNVVDSSAIASEIRDYDRVGISLKDVLSGKSKEDDLVLLPGDRLVVPRVIETVRVRGEVLYPTAAKFARSQGFKAYINQAGGYSENAKRSKGYVVYANGEASRVKGFLFLRFHPKVKPGSEIVVPRKQPKSNPIRLDGIMGLITTALILYTLIKDTL